MKIVAYSNHDIETENDYLVADNIKHKNHANTMLNALRDTATNESRYFYKLVEDDYKLYKWEP